jgi:hypothetical protein
MTFKCPYCGQALAVPYCSDCFWSAKEAMTIPKLEPITETVRTFDADKWARDAGVMENRICTKPDTAKAILQVGTLRTILQMNAVGFSLSADIINEVRQAIDGAAQ